MLLPEKCIFCLKVVENGAKICSDCANTENLMIKHPICKKCGRSKNDCNCFNQRREYKRLIGCFNYKTPVAIGLSKLKFYNNTVLATEYAAFMAQNIKSKYKGIHFDGILFVPMHWVRKIFRGYNQSELLAKHIAKILNIELINHVLYKRKNTKQQKRLPSKMRAANVLDSFSVKKCEKIKGKTLLLIDDVSTTGSTLNECAKMLKLSGAKEIYCATFALSVLNLK